MLQQKDPSKPKASPCMHYPSFYADCWLKTVMDVHWQKHSHMCSSICAWSFRRHQPLRPTHWRLLH